MQIAILGAGRVGSTVGRLWHAAGHDVTFAARDAARPRALAAELIGRGIRVNTITIGPTATRLLARSGSSQEILQALNASVADISDPEPPT